MIVDGEKICIKCKQKKQISNFYNATFAKDGKCPYCKDCKKINDREWIKRNPEMYKDRNDRNRLKRRARMTKSEISKYDRGVTYKKKYGITLEEYNVVLEQQDGVCAICKQIESCTYKGNVRPLNIDHDHDTGKARGLLCSHCNCALGNFRDNLAIVESAIVYLTYYS